MKLRIKALRSLRWNYKWSGAWNWLKGRHCWKCWGAGEVVEHAPPTDPLRIDSPTTCPTCNGEPKRGYQRILSEPEQVLAEQDQLASGAYV